VAWLAHQNVEFLVPLRLVVDRLGGAPSVLEHAVRLAEVLTADALAGIEPLDLEVAGEPLAMRLARSWHAMSSSPRAVLAMLAAFATPVAASHVAAASGLGLVEVLPALAQLHRAGWVWGDGAGGFGVDGLGTRWLQRMGLLGEAWARHADWLDAMEALDLRWFADRAQARRRAPGRLSRLAPAEAWYRDLMGGELEGDANQRLLEAHTALIENDLEGAIDAFSTLGVPAEPSLRLRWSVIGAELAAHGGDLVWMEELLDAGRADEGADVHPFVRFRHAMGELELAHLRGEPLGPPRTRALRAAQSLASPEPQVWVLETLWRTYRFQRTPDVDTYERMLELAHQGRLYPGGAGARAALLAMEVELGLPPSEDVEEVARELDFGYRDALATFWLSLALAALPEHKDTAEAWFWRAPHEPRHMDNRLRLALLERLLHGASEPMAELGGEALLQRVERLCAGDGSALAGDGWHVLRHALR
jgi:hypothetical protein